MQAAAGCSRRDNLPSAGQETCCCCCTYVHSSGPNGNTDKDMYVTSSVIGSSEAAVNQMPRMLRILNISRF